MLFRVRRGVAGLLALLLAVTAAPAPAWQAPATRLAGGHQAAAGIGSHHPGVHDPGLTAAAPDREAPPGHHDQMPRAIACCAALHCAMLLADLQPAPAELLRPFALRARTAVAARQPAGLEIAPALPPPRDAA